MQSSLRRQVSFYARAGDVSITPPLGPMLSQHGIDVRSFCNMFNTETKTFDKGFLLKVVLNIYQNNTFSYIIKSSPLFFLFELGSDALSPIYKGISLYHIYLISFIKNFDYNFITIKDLFKIIIIEVKKNRYKIIERACEHFYYLYI
jgi:ribosomal protein L11